MTASSRGRGLTYAWDLDNDGAFDDATGQTVSHTFSAAGEAVVRVQATDEDGRVGGTLRRIAVHAGNRAPSVAFSVPGTARTGQQILVSGFGSDPDGRIDEIELDLDDDGTYEVTRANFFDAPVTFASAGVKRVRARVTDDAGLSAVATATIDVHSDNYDPFVSLSLSPASPKPGSTGDLQAFASDLDGTIARYEFDLDADGTYEVDGGTEESTAVAFPVAGQRILGVRVTDNLGAVATARTQITVKEGDDPPSLSIFRVAGSGPPRFNAFGSDEDGDVVEYAWDLDDDNVYDDLVGELANTAQLPSALPGEYEIGVRVTDDGGNATTRRQVVTIRDVPAIARQVMTSPAQPRDGDLVQLFTTSVVSFDPSSEVAWDLDGDGAFDDATSLSTSRRYPTGAHPVAVRVTAPNGSMAIGTAIVNVSPGTGNLIPGAQFVNNPPAPRTGTTVTFFDNSFDSDGTIAGREWDLDGDGAFDDSTANTPTTTFAIAGVHQVALRVTDDDGAIAVQRHAVDVHDGNFAPRVTMFSTRSEVLTDQAVNVSAFGSGLDDGISEYAWDLDDDGAFDDLVGPTATAASPSFASAGSHRIRVRVTDEGGATDVDALVFEARVPGVNRAPRVALSGPSAVRVGIPASFFAPATDPDGDSTTAQWDTDDDGAFDDATGLGTSVTFATAGVKTVRVRVSDGRGGTGDDLTTVQVRATNIPPTILNFSVQGIARVGRATRLAASATDPDGSFGVGLFGGLVLTYDLDGDGAFDDTPTPDTFGPLWTPSSTAPVTLGLRATDADGATATRTIDVTPSAENLAPVVTLSNFGQVPAAGGTLSLFASAYDPDGLNSGFFGSDPPVTIDWDLDADGQFDDATGFSTSLAVPTQGEYTVAARATDPDGGTSTEAQTFRIGSQQPSADFTISNLTPEQNATVTLTSSAGDPDGTIAARSWDLDDDGVFDDGTGTTATVAFSAAGLARVGHKVRDSDGDVGVEYKLVDVRSTANPVASFTRSPASPQVGENVTFTSTSTDPQGSGDIATLAWDLDDDGAFDDATGPTAARSFATAGTKGVRLMVTDQAGNTDEIRQTFSVGANGTPVSSFTRHPATGTVGEPLTFTSTATDDGTIALREWDLDDDGAFDDATGTTATATFATPGAKTVRHRVTDDDGAVASAAQTFDVVTGVPVARFGVSPATPGIGQVVTFTSTSVDADGTIASHEWDLDDDGAFDDATGASATRTFAAAGDFDIALRVTDDDSRTASTVTTVTVRSGNLAPQVALAASRTSPRVNQSVTFTATASDRDGDALTEYAFDLDGDGDFEGGGDQIGTAATATRSFDTADDELIVRVRVTDARGASATDDVTLAVVAGNQVPVAYASPDSDRKRRPAADAGATFTLFGYGWDPDDSSYSAATGVYDDGIALWEWDVNGDGDYADAVDRSGADLQTIEATLGAGETGVRTHTVSLRLTDPLGATSTHTFSVETYEGNTAPRGVRVPLAVRGSAQRAGELRRRRRRTPTAMPSRTRGTSTTTAPSTTRPAPTRRGRSRPADARRYGCASATTPRRRRPARTSPTRSTSPARDRWSRWRAIRSRPRPARR